MNKRENGKVVTLRFSELSSVDTRLNVKHLHVTCTHPQHTEITTSSNRHTLRGNIIITRSSRDRQVIFQEITSSPVVWQPCAAIAVCVSRWRGCACSRSVRSGIRRGRSPRCPIPVPASSLRGMEQRPPQCTESHTSQWSKHFPHHRPIH